MNSSLGWGVLVVVVLAVAGYLVWGPSAKDQSAEGPVTIGVSAPLTGEAASFGEWTKAGIDLALKEINDAGGINGQPVTVIYEDDKCNQTGASVMQKLTSIDKVTAVLGPVCSAAAGPAVPIAEASKTPTIIWASAPSLPIGKEYIFRSYPSDAFQGKFAAEYVFNEMGKKKAALLYTKNDWGQGLHDTFTKRFTELGGTIVHDEGVSQDVNDLRTVLTKVKSTDADMIYIPLYPVNAVAAVKAAKDLKVSLPMVGGDGLETQEFLSVPEAEGVILTSAHFENPDDFKARVKEATGVDSGFVTPLAYDTFKLLIEVIKKAGTNNDAIKEELQKVFYSGVAIRTISFDEEGDLASAEFDVKVAKNGKTEILK